VLDDLSPLDLVGQLAMGPVTDRASRLLGGLTGHGDDLDDLLGSEGGGPAGARGIIQDRGIKSKKIK